MPSPLSMVLPKVPIVLPLAKLKTTANPPVVSLLPLASSACKVTVVAAPTGA